MLSNLIIFRRSIAFALTVTALAGSASAQIQFLPAPGTAPGDNGNVACMVNGNFYISNNSDDCQGEFPATQIAIGAPGNDIILDATTGVATFNGPANFTDNVQMSGLQAFSGTTTFNSTVTVNNNMTTNGISNTGLITTGSLSSNTIFGNSATITNVLSANGTFTGSLSALAGANVNMGGNQVHGVAAGTADTDAVNVAQLNAATSGIATDITALETTTATHTTQIATLETTTATHTTQIAAIEAVNTTQASQITAIQAVNTTQSSQISALQAAQESIDDSIDTLFDLRSRDRRDMKQGVAAAMSMAQAPMPSGPGRVSYAVNGATFRGEYAVGASLNYRLNTEAPMAVSVGASFAGNKNNGFRLGVAGEF